MNRQRPIPPSRRDAGRMNSAAPPAMGGSGDPPVTVGDPSTLRSATEDGPTGTEQVIWFKPVAFTEHGTTLPLFRTPRSELRTQDDSHSNGSKLIQPNPTKSPLRNPPRPPACPPHPKRRRSLAEGGTPRSALGSQTKSDQVRPLNLRIRLETAKFAGCPGFCASQFQRASNLIPITNVLIRTLRPPGVIFVPAHFNPWPFSCWDSSIPVPAEPHSPGAIAHEKRPLTSCYVSVKSCDSQLYSEAYEAASRKMLPNHSIVSSLHKNCCRTPNDH